MERTRRSKSLRPRARCWMSAVLLLGLSAGAVTGQTASQFLRGDCNVDGSLDVSDAVFFLLFNFAGGSTPECLDACDANDDGSVTGQVSDAAFFLGYIFLGGALPPDPGPIACGEDPTADTVDCQSYDKCSGDPPIDPCPVLAVSSTDAQRRPTLR